MNHKDFLVLIVAHQEPSVSPSWEAWAFCFA